MLHSKNETPVLGSSLPVLGVELKTGVEHILVIFWDSHNGLGESFPLMWQNIGQYACFSFTPDRCNIFWNGCFVFAVHEIADFMSAELA